MNTLDAARFYLANNAAESGADSVIKSLIEEVEECHATILGLVKSNQRLLADQTKIATEVSQIKTLARGRG